MATSGWVPFGTCANVAGANTDWTNDSGSALSGTEVSADDGDYAGFIEATGGISDRLRCTNAALSGVVPDGATITDLQFRLRRFRDPGSAITVANTATQIVIGGSPTGSPLVTVGDWPTTEALMTLTAGLQGTTPTRAQVVASNFGVDIIVTLNEDLGSPGVSPTHFIDLVEVQVTYTPAAVASPKGGRMLLGVGIGI